MITEICGRKACGFDFVEIYNAGSTNLPLAGLSVTFSRLDGSGQKHILIRDKEILLAPGQMAVMKVGFSSGCRTITPSYDLTEDFGSSGFYEAAIVEISACGEVLDRVFYRDLPAEGSWSFDGQLWPPDHQANDEEALWCSDEGISTNGCVGTPGERNRLCER